jgi:hypothetical protein
MSVHEWFEAWLADHLARHCHADLPDPAEPSSRAYYRGWTNQIIVSGLRDRETWDTASESLMAEAVPLSRHFGRLMDLARQAASASITDTKAQTAAPESLPATREDAEAASRKCEHCGGSGWMTVVYARPEATRSATNPTSPIPPSVSAFCICPHGRFLKRSQAADLVRRIPDLQDVLDGRSVWTLPPEPTPEERRHYSAMVIEALNQAQQPQPPRS